MRFSDYWWWYKNIFLRKRRWRRWPLRRYRRWYRKYNPRVPKKNQKARSTYYAIRPYLQRYVPYGHYVTGLADAYLKLKDLGAIDKVKDGAKYVESAAQRELANRSQRHQKMKDDFKDLTNKIKGWFEYNPKTELGPKFGPEPEPKLTKHQILHRRMQSKRQSPFSEKVSSYLWHYNRDEFNKRFPNYDYDTLFDNKKLNEIKI